MLIPPKCRDVNQQGLASHIFLVLQKCSRAPAIVPVGWRKSILGHMGRAVRKPCPCGGFVSSGAGGHFWCCFRKYIDSRWKIQIFVQHSSGGIHTQESCFQQGINKAMFIPQLGLCFGKGEGMCVQPDPRAGQCHCPRAVLGVLGALWDVGLGWE